MQRPTVPTKKYKSKNKKTYDVNILLPAPKIKRRRLGTLPMSDSKIAPMKTEDISAPEAVIVEASNDDLVLTVKQSVVDVLLETNNDQEWDENELHFLNFDGKPISESLTLRDIKGNSRGSRLFRLEHGATHLDALLTSASPYLASAVLQFALRSLPSPLVPTEVGHAMLSALESNQGKPVPLQVSAIAASMEGFDPEVRVSL